MSWLISVSGHENEGPNPPPAEKLEAVAAAAVKEAKAQGLHPTYTDPGGAISYAAAEPAAEADKEDDK